MPDSDETDSDGEGDSNAGTEHDDDPLCLKINPLVSVRSPLTIKQEMQRDNRVDAQLLVMYLQQGMWEEARDVMNTFEVPYWNLEVSDAFRKAANEILFNSETPDFSAAVTFLEGAGIDYTDQLRTIAKNYFGIGRYERGVEVFNAIRELPPEECLEKWVHACVDKVDIGGAITICDEYSIMMDEETGQQALQCLMEQDPVTISLVEKLCTLVDGLDLKPYKDRLMAPVDAEGAESLGVLAIPILIAADEIDQVLSLAEKDLQDGEFASAYKKFDAVGISNDSARSGMLDCADGIIAKLEKAHGSGDVYVEFVIAKEICLEQRQMQKLRQLVQICFNNFWVPMAVSIFTDSGEDPGLRTMLIEFANENIVNPSMTAYSLHILQRTKDEEGLKTYVEALLRQGNLACAFRVSKYMCDNEPMKHALLTCAEVLLSKFEQKKQWQQTELGKQEEGNDQKREISPDDEMNMLAILHVFKFCGKEIPQSPFDAIVPQLIKQGRVTAARTILEMLDDQLHT